MKLALSIGPGDGHLARVASMLAAQRARPAHQACVRDLGCGAVGWLLTSEHDSKLVRPLPDGLLLFAGVPLGRADDLTSLEGAFNALRWDASSGRLIVVTDFLGLQPLYLARRGRNLLLASEIRGIAAVQDRVEMDPEGWGGFVGFGFFLGEATSVVGVRRAPAATVATYDASSGAFEERKYDRWPPPERVGPAAAVDGIADALRREVEAYTQFAQPETVLLSGGFDSRLILCLLRRAGLPVKALTVAHRDERRDADGRYARRLAQTLGVDQAFHVPPPGFFSSDAYLDYLVLNEVVTPSLNLFITQVAQFIHPGLGTVWDGVALGYILAFPRIRRPDVQLYVRCRSHGMNAPIWEAARRLFAPPLAGEMQTRFQAQLRRELQDCPPGDSGLLYFDSRHQMRNRTGHNPLKVYGNEAPCITPGASREIWRLSLALPFAEKWDFRLYLELFRRHFPEALEQPFCSNGQLLSARVRLEPLHYWDRLFPPPGALRLGRALRARGFLQRPEPPLVGRVLRLVDPGHPDLAADYVAALRRAPGRDAVSAAARTLLFYWQIWRWLMEGRLTTFDKRVLAEAP